VREGVCDLSEAALMPRSPPRWRVARSAAMCARSCRWPLASPAAALGVRPGPTFSTKAGGGLRLAEFEQIPAVAVGL
jgi:hypothetical protein